ncbi:MAG: hypothetical protein PHD97_03015 [Bacteroidales bacterium]|nr:hypothetical protein [Bacteroidales bacterium]
MKKIIYNHISKDFVLKQQVDDIFNVKNLPLGFYKTLGNKNPDKIFYVIWLDKMGGGFFSNLSLVLCHLKIAHDSGMIPVIDFQNFKSLYNEQGLINNTLNAWEYYFKPVSEFPLNEVYESKNVFFSTGEYPPSMSYSITNVDGLMEIYRKYIFLQNHVEEKINRYSEKFNFNSRILGIHFRGQEQKYAAGHSFPPTKKQMKKYTDEILKKYKIEKIFIVTEEQEYLDFFIEKYGDKVLYTDSFRTHKVNAYNMHPRDNHRYLLGLDVLADAFLLSKCTGILSGDSNVSEFARFVNNKKFEFTYFIYNGTNSSNPIKASYLYGIKKRLPKYFGGLNDKIVIS